MIKLDEIDEFLVDFLKSKDYIEAFTQLKTNCQDLFSPSNVHFSLESVPDSDTWIPLIAVRVKTNQSFADFHTSRKQLFHNLCSKEHDQFCELLAIVKG